MRHGSGVGYRIRFREKSRLASKEKGMEHTVLVSWPLSFTQTERYMEGTVLVSWPLSFTQTERRREAGDGGERWRRRCTEVQGEEGPREEGSGGHGVSR
jgi:hypothetical protein